MFAELEVSKISHYTLSKTNCLFKKQNSVTQSANQEYQNAKSKVNRTQGGKKLSLELTSHYQKRILSTARKEFDVLFDLATALQEKVLTYHYNVIIIFFF